MGWDIAGVGGWCRQRSNMRPIRRVVARKRAITDVTAAMADVFARKMTARLVFEFAPVPAAVPV